MIECVGGFAGDGDRRRGIGRDGGIEQIVEYPPLGAGQSYQFRDALRCLLDRPVVAEAGDQRRHLGVRPQNAKSCLLKVFAITSRVGIQTDMREL